MRREPIDPPPRQCACRRAPPSPSLACHGQNNPVVTCAPFQTSPETPTPAPPAPHRWPAHPPDISSSEIKLSPPQPNPPPPPSSSFPCSPRETFYLRTIILRSEEHTS